MDSVKAQRKSELVQATREYFVRAKTAPYEDLIRPYAKLWLSASRINDEVPYPEDVDYNLYWPATHEDRGTYFWWRDLLNDIPADLWHKPSLPSAAAWDQVKEVLLLLVAEIPLIAQFKKWMIRFVQMNETRSQTSSYVYLPNEGRKYHITEAWKAWKLEIVHCTNRNETITRQNVPRALETLIDGYNWYPQTSEGMLRAVKEVMQHELFTEFLNLRSKEAPGLRC